MLSNLGRNVRQLRLERGLSQKALAETASISRRMVIAIEVDGTNVSLSVLDRLAAALGCSLTRLLRNPAGDNRRIEQVAWTGARSPSMGLLLGSAPATREAELWIWSLASGERYPSEDNSSSWHEMIYVITGQLDLELHDRTAILTEGQFLIFSSAERYVFANSNQAVTRFVRNVVL
jgi:transcriptional regulator with XRE-family HTH domain